MGPPELEFKKNKRLSWSQQMGVVVAMLVQAGHEDWIRWVIEVRGLDWPTKVVAEYLQVLEIALAARTEIVVAVDGPNGAPVNGDERDEDDERRVRDFAGPSRDAIAKFAQAGEVEVD